MRCWREDSSPVKGHQLLPFQATPALITISSACYDMQTLRLAPAQPTIPGHLRATHRQAQQRVAFVSKKHRRKAARPRPAFSTPRAAPEGLASRVNADINMAARRPRRTVLHPGQGGDDRAWWGLCWMLNAARKPKSWCEGCCSEVRHGGQREADDVPASARES